MCVSVVAKITKKLINYVYLCVIILLLLPITNDYLIRIYVVLVLTTSRTCDLGDLVDGYLRTNTYTVDWD